MKRLEKNVFLHVSFFLLGGMDLQLFWHQWAWLEILVMRTRLLKTFLTKKAGKKVLYLYSWSRLGQRHSLQSLTLTFYFYKNIYQEVVYVYFYESIFQDKSTNPTI